MNVYTFCGYDPADASIIREQSRFELGKTIHQELNSPSFPSFPPCNIFTDKAKDALVITFALAGYSKENIKISTENDNLTIRGDNNLDKDEKDNNIAYIKRGIKHSKFTRRYDFGRKYNINKADVTFKDGLLIITVPIREEMKPQELQIK